MILHLKWVHARGKKVSGNAGMYWSPTTLTKSACPFRVHNNIGCAYESLACEQASSTQPVSEEIDGFYNIR